MRGANAWRQVQEFGGRSDECAEAEESTPALRIKVAPITDTNNYYSVHQQQRNKHPLLPIEKNQPQIGGAKFLANSSHGVSDRDLNVFGLKTV